jgi:hypothetical protein
LTVPPFAGNVPASRSGRAFDAAGAQTTVSASSRYGPVLGIPLECGSRCTTIEGGDSDLPAFARGARLPAADAWYRGILDSSLSGSVFTYALIASLAIHAVLAVIQFRAIEAAKRQDRGPPLEIALVNAKSIAKPMKADILAQSNLEGGGNTDADRRAKTPLPVLPKERQSSEIAVVTQRVEKLERQTKELMTQMKGCADCRRRRRRRARCGRAGREIRPSRRRPS